MKRAIRGEGKSGGLLSQKGVGFRYFRLAESNFRIWRGDTTAQDANSLAEQINLFAHHKLKGSSEQAVLYEILLKSGFELTVDISTERIEGATVHLIAGGLLAVCLEEPLRAEPLRALAARPQPPSRIVVLDAGFRGNDQLKTNLVLELRSRGIDFRTV